MRWLMGLFSSQSGSGASPASAPSPLQQARDELRSLAAALVNLPSQERERSVRDIASIADRQPELGAEVIGVLRGVKDDPVEDVRQSAVILLGYISERHPALQPMVIDALCAISEVSHSYTRHHAINQLSRIGEGRADLAQLALRALKDVSSSSGADEGNRVLAINCMGSIAARHQASDFALTGQALAHFHAASTDRAENVRRISDEWIGRLKDLPKAGPSDPAP